nr:T9SS type A sorting domain-containing protein [uncultured Pedobacter sp.]
MKKILLTIGLLTASLYGFSQFTAGNLVVSRYGDPLSTLGGNNAATAIYLVEYTKDGAVVGSALALRTSSDANGSALTGNPGGSNEGLLTLSPDGSLLTVFGHSVDAGGTISNGTSGTDRIIGVVKQDKTYTSTLHVTSASVVNPRCAITTDATKFYIVGSTGGVQLVDAGTSAITSINSDNSPNRGLAIFNGQLYANTNAGSTAHIAKVGTGLPSTASTLTALNGLSNAPATPNQVVFFKSTAGAGEPDLMYAANDGDGTLVKYAFDGTTWNSKGSVAITSTTGAFGFKSITGYLAGGTVHLFGTTGADLFKVDDAVAATSTISTASNAPVILASATVGKEKFQSVAFTPGTNIATLPVELTTFQGVIENNGVKLTWTTASEKNSKSFMVQRAGDDKVFAQIGEVPASGDSNVERIYTFKDASPLAGNNYYKLVQTDFDANQQAYGPIVVSTSLNTSSFNVSAGENVANLGLSSLVNSQGNVKVFNTSGAKLAEQAVTIQRGFNSFAIPVNQLKSGVYILTLTINGKTVSKKFIK